MLRKFFQKFEKRNEKQIKPDEMMYNGINKKEQGLRKKKF